MNLNSFCTGDEIVLTVNAEIGVISGFSVNRINDDIKLKVVICKETSAGETFVFQRCVLETDIAIKTGHCNPELVKRFIEH